MAWRIVVQPNGYLARFSDIVDMFTHYDMTESDAYDVCLDDLGRNDAKDKVSRGVSAGLQRFYDEIERIRLVHGDAKADEVVRVLSMHPRDRTEADVLD